MLQHVTAELEGLKMSSTVLRKQSKKSVAKGNSSSKSTASGKKRSASRLEAERAKQVQALADQFHRALGYL